MREAYRGKNHKVTVGIKLFIKNIIRAGKKSGCMLNKDWLGSEMVA